MRPLKVFIVDDDRDFAEGVALSLEMAGHEVDFAHSGEEAVRRFREQDFDVTLMDVRMPGLNGVESFFEFQKIRPEAKVIMMTAYSVEDLLQQGIEGGAMGVIHKPFSSEQLLSALDAAKPAGLILVADDDADFVEGVERTLVDEGYHVCVASTGEEAVEKALTGRFDVLLLDVRLPVLNGLEVYQKLLEQGRALPTIVISGYEAEEHDTIRRILEMSARQYLRKPFGSAELLQALRDIR